MEFLVRQIDKTTPDQLQSREQVRPAEKEYAAKLREDGVLRHLWRMPGSRSALGWYAARDIDHLHQALSGLPSFPFIEVEIEPLATHPQESPVLPGESSQGL